MEIGLAGGTSRSRAGVLRNAESGIFLAIRLLCNCPVPRPEPAALCHCRLCRGLHEAVACQWDWIRVNGAKNLLCLFGFWIRLDSGQGWGSWVFNSPRVTQTWTGIWETEWKHRERNERERGWDKSKYCPHSPVVWRPMRRFVRNRNQISGTTTLGYFLVRLKVAELVSYNFGSYLNVLSATMRSFLLSSNFLQQTDKLSH